MPNHHINGDFNTTCIQHVINYYKFIVQYTQCICHKEQPMCGVHKLIEKSNKSVAV